MTKTLLHQFLKKHYWTKKSGLVLTHTRIGCKDSNIYGGSYHIPNSDLDTFHRLYYDEVIRDNKKEFLTERQNDGNGALLYVDLDFRYNIDFGKREHTNE